MGIKKLLDETEDICSKCPYKPGLVSTLVNPCLHCRKKNYVMFKQFVKKLK